MPDALHHRDVFWAFKNPMQEASERILIQQGTEVMQIVKALQEFGLTYNPARVSVMAKDMIRGTSAPATWRKTEAEEQAEMAETAKRRLIAGAAQEIAAAGDVATKVGEGAQALQIAGLLPPPTLNKRTVASSLPTIDPAAVAA
jgi:hypothetical protein